jgi:hypothetical protein
MVDEELHHVLLNFLHNQLVCLFFCRINIQINRLLDYINLPSECPSGGGAPTDRTSPSGAISNAPGGTRDEPFDFIVA